MKWNMILGFLVLAAGLAWAQGCHQGVYSFELDGASFTAYADDYRDGQHDAACALEDFFAEAVANQMAFTVSSLSTDITKFGDFSFPEGGKVEVKLTFVYEADEGSSSPDAKLNLKKVEGDEVKDLASIAIPVTQAGETASIDLDFKPANEHGVFFGVGSDFGEEKEFFFASYRLAGGPGLPEGIGNAPGSINDLWQNGTINPVTGEDYDRTQGLVEDVFDLAGDEIGGIFEGETPDGLNYRVVTPKDEGGPTYIIETGSGGNVGRFIKAVKESPGAETAEVVYGTLVFGSLKKGNIVLTSAQNKGSFQAEFPEFEIVTQEEVSSGGLFGLSQLFAQPFIWMGNLWSLVWSALFG